ncbi:MAG: PD40 domain-containing protein [Verrucomicrobia bacterium]|nr:PD40 domain-containing protein [Verrucomicrobiota bacterium]
MTFSSLLVVLFTFSAQEQPPIVIQKDVTGARFLPVSMTGYSGEVQAVLKFDLEIAGFDIVNPETAQFNISGSNNSFVEGRVTDRVTKAALLANRYEGAPPRSLAHALADDIVLKITGKPGIARSKIAFKGDSGGRTEAYVADYDGANAVRATQDNALVVALCFASGGNKLLYTSYKSGNPDIYIHDLGSGQRTPVANYPGSNLSPAISRDGRRVAMIISKDGNPELYVSNVDRSNLTRLTHTRADESSPCWSPDGQSICVVSRKDGAPALYVVPASGGAMRRISTAGAGSTTEPDWSPDGKEIAFTALWREFQICVVPAKGGEVNVLTAGEDPSWAPNSRTIVFTKRVGDKRVLSLLDVPTKRVKTLDRHSGSRSLPSWAK